MRKELLAALLFVALIIPMVSAVPSAPANFAGALGGTVISNRNVALTWTISDTNAGCFGYYEVYRSVGYNTFTRLTTDSDRATVSYTDDDISVGAVHQYRLREVSLGDEGCGPTYYGTGTWTSDVLVASTDATATDVGSEIFNLVYVTFNVVVKYMPIILILAIAGALVVGILMLTRKSKGLGVQ